MSTHRHWMPYESVPIANPTHVLILFRLALDLGVNLCFDHVQSVARETL